MNKLFYYSALFLATTLLGCSNEQGDGALDPDYLEPGTSLVQVSFNYPTAAGYAVGDEDAGAGTAAEKEIKTLAFFVKTSHAFGKFFSDALPGSPNGFIEALTEVSPGNYTASFLIRSAKFDGTSEVVAIANYAESGLDFSEIGTMKKLHQVASNAMDGTTNISAPLLMYGAEPALNIVSEEAVPLKMDMERAVARVDVINLASEIVPEEGFILESVRILNAPAQTLLKPAPLLQKYAGVDFQPLLPTEGDVSIKYAYLYETANDTELNRPFVEIKGKYKGAVLYKKIPFRVVDKGIPGEYFPILRNYRYVVNINKTGDTEDLAFNMIVKDWDTGEDINVMPSMNAPKLTGFVSVLGTDQGVTWDEKSNTLTLTKTLTAPISLSFDASAFQDPKFSIATADDASAEFIKKSYVTAGELTGYASESVASKTTDVTPDENDPMPLKRKFTLTIPANFNEKVAVVAGTTHTNTLNIFVTALFSTPITIKYIDERQDAAPVLEGLDKFTAAGGAKWEADTKTLNITDATAENVFNVVVRGMQDNDVALVSTYDANPTTLSKKIVVEKNELEGYALTDGFLTRTYKITVPAIKGTDTYPSSTQITFFNTVDKKQTTTITVKYAPFFMTALKSSDSKVVINQATKLIDFTGASTGTTPSVSFFASANTAITATSVVNEGATANFFTTSIADETDRSTTQQYGPGKRITLRPKALVTTPELASFKVTAGSVTHNFYAKSLKTRFSRVMPASNSNMIVDGNSIYLSVNGESARGSIVYTFIDDAGNAPSVIPQVTYDTRETSPSWATITPIITALASPNSFFNLTKREVRVVLPSTIKNPAAVTSFIVPGTPSLRLIPVYPSGQDIVSGDKLLQPLLYSGTWWSPVNVGQTVISKAGDDVNNGGNLFQWGRKQALTYASAPKAGPVASAVAAGNYFITVSDSPHDWLSRQNDNLWNSGSEAAPKKTGNDPCPSGWRVPTKLELDKLTGTTHTLSAGLLTVSAASPSGAKMYFSAVGYRSIVGTPGSQGTIGYFWSSAVSGTNASYVYFNIAAVSAARSYRSNGMSVRCVQD